MTDALQDNLEELATLESLDNGKPYTIAKTVDVPMASLSASSLQARTDCTLACQAFLGAHPLPGWGCARLLSHNLVRY